ncbi:hypothetical protein M407DRAFT_29364 [Tulasnella calospora MUT 4182]|uniref:Uncharacterized protein n=1 Tax=Tulasnella calospora MUT 4182 TaxID=1051891 RepID=A0A0C3KHM6_9AGAM|nr:hypothetical protein M407DRAFT_29364 [Tulasnella calospora MUT 4182]
MEKESTLGRESRDVKREAERLGLGFEAKENGKPEGRWKVREEARKIVDNMVEVLKGLQAVMGQRRPPAQSAANGGPVEAGH